ncbi:MAG: hypothetical protein CMH34_08900 [Microbacterium sp.]|nr:hypothetical protein [Microbacterium sp.]
MVMHPRRARTGRASDPRGGRHGERPAAAAPARRRQRLPGANLDSIGLVDSLSYWTFTDIFEEAGGGQLPFHGGFGMLTYHGVPKPTYHGYRFLGDELLARNGEGAITRDSAGGAISALLYNYPAEVTQTVPASFDMRENADRTLATGAARSTTVRVSGVAAGTRFRVELLSPESGNAIARWHELGSPVNPSRDDIASIREAAMDLRTWEVEAGEDGLDTAIDLPAWAVALVTQIG